MLKNKACYLQPVCGNDSCRRIASNWWNSRAIDFCEPSNRTWNTNSREMYVILACLIQKISMSAFDSMHRNFRITNLICYLKFLKNNEKSKYIHTNLSK